MNSLKTKNYQLPTVLVTGAKGQLGFKIRQILSERYDLILTDADTLDITDKTAVDNFFATKKPDFVIHAAAYTQVDKAEDNPALCNKINIDGTKNIADAAKKYDSILFYISTDYVFDGKKNNPYKEEDMPNPLSEYGKSKFEGEKIVQKLCSKYYILRVSWLFGDLPENYPGSNFVETMLRLAPERDSLTVVNDQIGSPTYTGDLVETIDDIIKHNIPYGLYHFSGNGPCSWYDFAKEIFKISKNNIELKPITSNQYPQKAKRPPYSYLSKDKIEKTLGIEVRTWQKMLKSYLDLKRS